MPTRAQDASVGVTVLHTRQDSTLRDRHERYFYRAGSRVPEEASVGLLLKQVPCVSPDTRVSDVYELFMQDRQLYAMPVLDGGIPVGLINRNRLIELYSKPFTRELYGRKSIMQFVDRSPIIVDEHKSIDDLARVIIDAGMQYMFDGFIISSGGRYAGMGTGHDLLNEITERKQAHLYYLAHYDQLTGLANRLLFTDRLIQAGEHTKRHHRQVGVLFLDLDRFKLINDTLGHPAGDLLLRTVSERLLGCVRRQDTVARLGGDEFTIVLESLHGPQDAASVAQKILRAMAEPFWLAQHEVHVTTSIGIAMLPSDGEDVDDLIRKADTAMYHAKEQGRNNYQFFTAEMNTAVSAKLSMESKLRHAMDRQELVVYYQPVVELCTGRIAGAEALLRWRDPDTQDLVPPSQFIPIAEETGLIVPLGEWVLRAACQQNKDWQDAGLPPLRVAVNLSARQLRQQGFTATVARILQETGLDGSSLALEITETILMQNMDEAVAALRELDAMGIRLSIDDFGTGYSSLAYLKRLPIDILKIDRSFVRDIGSHDGSGAIPEAIIAMAHSLRLEVVAEGVETAQQLAFLRERRCDAMQGFYVSAPVPAEELQSILQLNPNPLLPEPA